jgi:hypothetical protein
MPFLLQRGPAEDVTALGWQIDDQETFEIVLARVANAGVRVSEATPEECNLRGVERLWRFPGPKGMATEIFTAPTTSTARLRMLQSGFVTGASGMGHVAITARQPDRVRGYYDRVFDAPYQAGSRRTSPALASGSASYGSTSGTTRWPSPASKAAHRPDPDRDSASQHPGRVAR